MSDSTDLRVRFAPSPTGYLHVGGARTALFNWLYARRHGGTFVLRIEDTDRARSSTEHTRAILDGMIWLGLDWDEGPYHQADGLDRHRADALRMLEADKAYRCFCSAGVLDEKRAAAQARKENWRYDRHCLRNVTPEESARRAAAGEPHTIRFFVPEGKTEWDDAVHGVVSFANADLEDFIILRSDGTPIYNLAVVSDDIEMRITLVLRGDDHISNTPKQILLYRALDAAVPRFAHVPMILGADGKRLSKRHGATAIGEYEDQGILPQAMVNFLALIGWGPGEEREIFTIDELIERFSLEGIVRKAGVFDPTKLEWLNGQHLSRTPALELEPMVTEKLVNAGLVTHTELDERRDWYLHLIDLLKERARNLDDFLRQARPYFAPGVAYDDEALAKHWKNAEETAARMRALHDRFATVSESDWNPEGLEPVLRALADELGTSAAKLIHPARVAVTGMNVSPSIFQVLTALGKKKTLTRLEQAIERIPAAAGQVAP
ncbi:MAG TPA: glutamate--tRNA ligase [Longimicrobiales bacterium]|nr:glutamate--tRNA ligase [Longimicrobiales bacterium]